MYKIKTKKSVYKRFKVIAYGKLKRKQANMRHILTKKSKERKRRLIKKILISKKDFKNIKKCLPYK